MLDEEIILSERFKRKLKPFKFEDFGSLTDQPSSTAWLHTEKDDTVKALVPENPNGRTFDNERILDPNQVNPPKIRRHVNNSYYILII